MNVQKGISRQQLWMISLDMEISQDSVVRLIDLFVDHLDLEKLGFTKTKAKKEGCPIYQASDMLKLFYYGYINRIRSSRKLAAECCRNIELWWLLGQLKPGYHTIADFRKDNGKALKNAFKMFVSFLKGEDLLGGELVAIDGTKIRAQNNKSNNYNEGKLKKLLEGIEAKAESYMQELEQGDATEDKQAAAELNKKQIAEKLVKLKERKIKYEALEKTLKDSGEKQISTVDTDSRSLPIKDRITDVCYNVQAANDSKYSLVVDFDTINESDQGQLNAMSGKAKDILEVEQLTALGDKGYHSGKELEAAKKNNITTVVAYPQPRDRSDKIDPAYYTDKFIYDKKSDTYSCPQGYELKTNGKEYIKGKKDRTSYTVKTYTTTACSTCPFKKSCTTSKYRKIDRSEYQDIIDENNKRVDENPALYKRRALISEHVFGTFKRGWGYTYTLVKGLEKVDGEMAIIFTMYNLRRAMSILGVDELKRRLAQWKSTRQTQKTAILSSFQLYPSCYLQMAA
ncbi:MAG TPA: IS1182 family transposase [Candidatus Nitrosocosmicus sp.]|nr:IS1182 family transposase [Candidatus Nitrosocosmicus sp.]